MRQLGLLALRAGRVGRRLDAGEPLRLARARSGARFLPLRYRHLSLRVPLQPILQGRERSPPDVDRGGIVAAIDLVSIRATAETEPGAVGTAQRREREVADDDVAHDLVHIELLVDDR